MHFTRSTVRRGNGKFVIDSIQRGKRGQALMEGTMFMLVLAPVAIGLILLILNAGYGLINHQKIVSVATETARLVEQRRYVLGTQCPNYARDRQTIFNEASKHCNEMLEQVGLSAGDCQFDDSQGTTIKCTVNVKVRLFGGGVFPAIISQSATGIAAQDISACGSGADNEYLIGRLAFKNNDGSQRWILYMPLYAAEKENGNWPNPSGWTGGLQGSVAIPENRSVFITAAHAVDENVGPNGFRIDKYSKGQHLTGGF